MKRILLALTCGSLFATMASGQVLYDDFQGNGATTFGSSSKFNYIHSTEGPTTLNVANPNTTGNTSSTVARWQRPAAAYQSTQLALFQTMTNVALYASNAMGTPKIKMWVYTDAPVGTQVMITIGSRTDPSYPAGAYTTFVKNTTVTNAWEQLTFDWNPGGIWTGAPSDFGGASATDCGRFVIQMAGDAATAYTLYFDDIEGPELNAAPTSTAVLYDDFQNNTATDFGTASKFSNIANSNGAIDFNAANPSATGINTTTKVANWSRPAGEMYPNVSFALRSKIINAYPFASNLSGTPKITMKAYTNAPVGTEVLVRLDSANTGGSYPAYVYTTFRTVTTVQNAWETLTFDWVPNGTNGVAFGGTSATNVSRIAVIIDNTNTTAYSLYFDDVYGPETQAIVAGVTEASNIASSKVYPNPTVSDAVKLELNLKTSSTVKVTLSDLMGKEVMTIAEGTFETLSKEFSVANLKKGMYTVNYFVDGAAAKAEMLMVK